MLAGDNMATNPSSLKAEFSSGTVMFVAGVVPENEVAAALHPTMGTRGNYEDYSPGDRKVIDRAIRHLPGVVEYIDKKAKELAKATGSPNFEVVLQNRRNTSRPRAYVVPANGKGIREEKSKGVLLKAALGMAGK
jgi:hypothetical protein